jgi:hypothetical protein
MDGMTRVETPSPAVERLAHDLFVGRPGEPMAEELVGWLAGSGRFRAFTDAHRDKIRKKLRTAADAEALRDVRVELQVARLLLTDRRIELAFEAYGSGRAGPDFTVAFRGERRFNLEVTHRCWRSFASCRRARRTSSSSRSRGKRRRRSTWRR